MIRFFSINMTLHNICLRIFAGSLLVFLKTTSAVAVTGMEMRPNLSSSTNVVNNTINYERFTNRPKLVVTIVIDQFRADYLTRFEKQFLNASKSIGSGKLGGFRELIENGSYFPFSQYEVLQNMTCPGHAMILTGSNPAKTGISLNEYFDQKSKKLKYCVEDEKDGVSPRRLLTTTVGDELKNVSSDSKVFTVALKDRSAVGLGGHRANLALWFNSKNAKWETSTYYTNELPKWVQSENQRIEKLQAEKKIPKLEKKEWLSWSGGIDLSFDLLMQAIVNEKLGQRTSVNQPVRDLVAISLSTHDVLGHKFGPNAQEMEQITLHEDKVISKFLNDLNKIFPGLKDVVVVLTADHGVSPDSEYLKDKKIDSDRLDYLGIISRMNKNLDQAFGEQKEPWIISFQSFNFYLNHEKISERKLNLNEVLQVCKKSLLAENGVADVLVAEQILQNNIPVFLKPGLKEYFLTEFRNSFLPNQNGDLILVPKPFYYEAAENKATHMTAYNYDRMVPVVFYGGGIKKSVFINSAKVIDIAPTLSFMLGILPPPTSEGIVLPVYK